MLKKPILLAAFALLAGAAIFFAAGTRNAHPARRGFVATNGTRFVVDGKPFRFVGANVAVMYRDEDRARMPETLREAAKDGVRVLRVWAYGEGDENSSVQAVGGDRHDWPRTHPFRRSPDDWNEDAFIHLDHVLVEAARNNQRVQLCLTNWWRDTGGVTQYLKWAGVDDAADDAKPFGINIERAMLFYTNAEARRLFRQHIEKIVTRRNTVTGTLYKDDPTIMGYELMNEAQASTGRWAERRAWVAEMSAYIKSLDPDHLIAPGTWGYRTSWERREWLAEHSIATIDYCDVHNYPRDDHDTFVESLDALREFIENRAAAAFSIKKPLVLGEFGMAPEGFQNFSRDAWFRAYFENAAQAGAGGAMFWIWTPDPQRGYGVTYTNPRDETLRAEIRRAAALFAAQQNANPPVRLLDSSRHLVPRQFAFTRNESDVSTQPEISAGEADKSTLLYRFKPEAATSARFEKIGFGSGYIWGSGVGYYEYIVPARDKYRKVGSIIVRAHLQPVLPSDAHPPVTATRATLFINNKNFGSRLIAVEDPKQAITQEWRIDSYLTRLQATRGLALHIRFAVTADADLPYGLNISNYPYDMHGATPVEVELRRD